MQNECLKRYTYKHNFKQQQQQKGVVHLEEEEEGKARL